jgi:hypothetical protein
MSTAGSPDLVASARLHNQLDAIDAESKVVEDEIHSTFIVEKSKLVDEITEIRSMISVSGNVSSRTSEPERAESHDGGDGNKTVSLPGETSGKSSTPSKKDDGGRKKEGKSTLVKRNSSVRDKLRDRMKALRNADDAYDTELEIARLNKRYSSTSLLQHSGHARGDSGLPSVNGINDNSELSPSSLAKNFRPGRIRNMKPPTRSRSNLADIYDETMSDSDEHGTPHARGGFCCFGGGRKRTNSDRVVPMDD